MAVTGFKSAKSLGVGYFSTIVNLHPQVMVQHFVVDDSLNDVALYVTPVQSGIDADSFGSFGIAAKLDGVLVLYLSVGSPGNEAVNLFVKVFAVDLVKKCFEVEEASPLTQHRFSGSWSRVPDLGGVGPDKISQHRWCIFSSAFNEVCQRGQDVRISLKEHVM